MSFWNTGHDSGGLLIRRTLLMAQGGRLSEVEHFPVLGLSLADGAFTVLNVANLW